MENVCRPNDGRAPEIAPCALLSFYLHTTQLFAEMISLLYHPYCFSLSVSEHFGASSYLRLGLARLSISFETYLRFYSKTPILYRISIQKSSAKLSQFVSRNILSRDKMSQLLVACGLVLGACGFFYFLEPVIFVWHALAKITDPRSSLPVLKQGWTYSPLDQGSVPCCAHPSRDFNWSQIHCADDHLHLSQWIRDQAGACTIGAV